MNSPTPMGMRTGVSVMSFCVGVICAERATSCPGCAPVPRGRRRTTSRAAGTCAPALMLQPEMTPLAGAATSCPGIAVADTLHPIVHAVGGPGIAASELPIVTSA